MKEAVILAGGLGTRLRSVVSDQVEQKHTRTKVEIREK
jgi:NDP-sugar pyrophosphorylase family protein